MPDIPALIHAIRQQRRTPEPSDSLFLDCRFDELDRQALAMAIEDELHIEIGDATLERWQTVEDVTRFVESVGEVV